MHTHYRTKSMNLLIQFRLLSVSNQDDVLVKDGRCPPVKSCITNPRYQSAEDYDYCLALILIALNLQNVLYLKFTMKHWLANTHWIEKVKKSGPVGELNPGPLDVRSRTLPLRHTGSQWSHELIQMLVPFPLTWTMSGSKHIVLWSTQRLSTFMSTQRISRHVDITFNISTKKQ